MGRIWLAIRVFFIMLFNGAFAARVAQLVAERQLAAPVPEPAETKPQAAKQPFQPKPPLRSDAVTLLASLQREARFLDFIMEPVEAYSDAQIGAAVRDVHRECGKVLTRLMDIQPVATETEGADYEVPAGFDGVKVRLVGNVAGDPPFHGKLVHPGWQARKVELPAYSGSAAAAKIIAPVEVELK